MHSSGSGSEAHYLSQLERLNNENRQLKKRIEANERENRDLKRSVYDLSIRLNVLLKKRQKDMVPALTFDLDAALAEGTSFPSPFDTHFMSADLPSNDNEMNSLSTKPEREFVSTAGTYIYIYVYNITSWLS